jgi:hypothetical protein
MFLEPISDVVPTCVLTLTKLGEFRVLNLFEGQTDPKHYDKILVCDGIYLIRHDIRTI